MNIYSLLKNYQPLQGLHAKRTLLDKSENGFLYPAKLYSNKKQISL
jgi:hypothetical protein